VEIVFHPDKKFSPMSETLIKSHRRKERPPFEAIVLLLQGGGALGAYQGGVYQALSEANLHPDWVAGISIGALNAAIIAGNPPEMRAEKLRGFWHTITASGISNLLNEVWSSVSKGASMRRLVNQINAASALFQGVTNFYEPRLPLPYWPLLAATEATSFYDTKNLAATLMKFVDFDLINNTPMRLSVGAVNVRTGNFVYFDNRDRIIGPEHIIASAALPPGFPAIDIDGEYYWDGGLVSNTPLQWVLEYGPQQDTLAFQVDLWSARGALPTNLSEVATRRKEIIYSSRTRENSERFITNQHLRHAIANLLETLPEEMKEVSAVQALKEYGSFKCYNLVHLIYHARQYEGYSKDYEFSRLSMREHWRAGYYDTVRTLRHQAIYERPTNFSGVAIYDYSNRD
jgi:NTE family protein